MPTKYKWVTAAIVDECIIAASTKYHELEHFINSTEDDAQKVVYEERLIPSELVNSFVSHGGSGQVFSDGYEAFTEWVKYQLPRYDKAK